MAARVCVDFWLRRLREIAFANILPVNSLVMKYKLHEFTTRSDEEREITFS